MSPLLIDTRRVSEMTGIPVETLKYWRRHGKGPRWAQVGRHISYRPADVEEWVNSHFEPVPPHDPDSAPAVAALHEFARQWLDAHPGPPLVPADVVIGQDPTLTVARRMCADRVWRWNIDEPWGPGFIFASDDMAQSA